MAISFKIKHLFIIWPFLGMWKFMAGLFTVAKTTQMLINQWMDNQIVMCSFTEYCLDKNAIKKIIKY